MGKKKHKSAEEKRKTSKFVDVEASEEEDEEDGLSDFINEVAEEVSEAEEEEVSGIEETEEEASEIEELGPVSPPADIFKEEEEPFEVYSKKIEERYAAADEQIEVEEVPQQMLLPTERQPRLWLIRCTPKKEKHIVLALARKYMSLIKDSQLQITGVVHNEHLKGYIYIEAYQKQQVIQAIEGIQGVIKSSVTQIATKEMTEVLYVHETDPILYKEGNLFWMTKGKYAGDLVQIESLPQKRGMVTVKIVPRALSHGRQVLFSPKDYHPSEVYKVSGSTYIYRKETYRDGYLIKDVPTSHLSSTPTPTQQERKLFSSGTTKEAVHVVPGESVEVVYGALKGAKGTVVSLSGEDVVIEIGTRKVPVSMYDIKKRYAVGNEVVILSGRKKGKSGFIMSIDGDRLQVGINGFTEAIEVGTDEVRLGSIPEQQQEVPQRQQSIIYRRDPLRNKAGVIIAGKHKGKRGIVKDVFGDSIRVQLITNLEHVMVGKEEFEQKKEQAQPQSQFVHRREPQTRPERRVYEEGATTPVQAEEGRTTPIESYRDGPTERYTGFDG